MSTSLTVAQLIGSLTSQGYQIEIYEQKNGSCAILVGKKNDPKKGVAIKPLTTRMLKAALIKIKKAFEERDERD